MTATALLIDKRPPVRRVAPGDEVAGLLVLAVADLPDGRAVAHVEDDLGDRILEVPAPV